MNTRIFILAHAPLAHALRECALHVLADSALEVLALDVQPEAPPDTTLAAARHLLYPDADRPTLVLTDVLGATPCNVAQRLVQGSGCNARLVTGVNLPMLLRAISYSSEPLDAVVERALVGGAQGVMQLNNELALPSSLPLPLPLPLPVTTAIWAWASRGARLLCGVCVARRALTVLWLAVGGTPVAGCPHVCAVALGIAATPLTTSATATWRIAPTVATRATIGLFLVTNAFHHFAAGCFGCRSHDIATRGLACAAPDGLATHGNGFGLFTRFGAKAFDELDFDALLGEAFNVLHEAFFVHAHQVDGFTACAGTTGATNAVHVVFADVGDFVVHHVWQVVNVDAARSDVSGNQCPDVAALETSQRLGAGSLALVAVQRHGVDAVFGEVLGHVVGPELGPGEHQHLAPVVLIDDVYQHRFFLAATHWMDELGDALHGGVAWGHLDALRVAQQPVGQVPDLVTEGGREQQTLLLAGDPGQNFFHVMDEAHVQHAVGLVQHQHLHLRQVQKALLCQVQQATRGGNQHVHTFFQLRDLGVHAHATKHHTRIDGGQVFAIGAHRFFDLRGQLAGRCQHQRADGFAAKTVFARLAQRQLVQHGQRERGGFACAGLRTSQQVLPFNHSRNGLRLNGGGRFIALLLHGLQNGRGQIQFFKVHGYCARPGRREHRPANPFVGGGQSGSMQLGFWECPLA